MPRYAAQQSLWFYTNTTKGERKELRSLPTLRFSPVDYRQNSSVHIQGAHRLDGPEIEARWGETFRKQQNRTWGPFNLLYNGSIVFFPGEMRPERCVYHPPPSGGEVKERVEQYIYSPARSSWQVVGRILPLHVNYHSTTAPHSYRITSGGWAMGYLGPNIPKSLTHPQKLMHQVSNVLQHTR